MVGSHATVQGGDSLGKLARSLRAFKSLARGCFLPTSRAGSQRVSQSVLEASEPPADRRALELVDELREKVLNALRCARTGFENPPSKGGVNAVCETGEVHDSSLADWLLLTGSRGDLSTACVEQNEGNDPSSPHGLSAHVVAPQRALQLYRTSSCGWAMLRSPSGHSVRKSRGSQRAHSMPT